MTQSSNDKVPEIKKKALFDAPIERVWKAVATSEGIEEWFMPNDFKPVEGYKFTIKSQFEDSPCQVVTVNKPYELSFTWGDRGWVVSFYLKEVENRKTEFTLVHSGWGQPEEVMSVTSKTQLDTRNTMNKGWEMIVHEKLRKAVEG
ncbi:SRPBCC domain-containing protein [Halobacillus sp. Marseille-P3879]|uniref:SRPBCC family protein n=1 Tax=Halobacillus sp. Marseille-P3879 TaxID=2045014 RepID=UPI000C7C8232|nr:SRPBCC domain-containing protein [Halobacillus sp. Marseille-P3879]